MSRDLSSEKLPSSVQANTASSLANIRLPLSIKEIGSDAFYGCSSLTRIEIPVSVKEIGGGAFNHCNSLETVVMKAGTPAKIKKDSFSKRFQKEGTLVVPNIISYQSDPKSNWAKFRNITL